MKVEIYEMLRDLAASEFSTSRPQKSNPHTNLLDYLHHTTLHPITPNHKTFNSTIPFSLSSSLTMAEQDTTIKTTEERQPTT